MNKSELVSAIQEKAGLKKSEAHAVVEAILETISNELKEGNSVSLIGFGTFKVKDRPARTGRNPATKEAIEIPATRVPAFVAGKNLKDVVAESAKKKAKKAKK